MHTIIKTYKHIGRTHLRALLILGCSYGSLISFIVYGPVMRQVAGALSVNLLSSLGLACVVLGLTCYKPMQGRFKHKLKTTTQAAGFCACILLLLFTLLPVTFQAFSIALLGFTAGLVIAGWGSAVLTVVKAENRTGVICLALLIAYGSKYLANILVPYLGNNLMTIIPALLILVSVYLSGSASFSTANEAEPKTSHFKHRELFVLIFLIYFTAGITYVSIFPQFSDYAFQNYYNVAPFLVAVLVAGLYGNHIARKSLLYIGLAFLGLSFTFFIAFSGILSFFLIQTSSEISWAFLNVFILVLLYDLAAAHENTGIFITGGVSLIGGVLAGGALTNLSLKLLSLNPITYGAIAHIALFVAIGFLSQIPETYAKKNQSQILFPTEKVRVSLIKLLSSNFGLTPREVDVVMLLLAGYSNPWIAKQLFISPNTAKFHTKNIFNKLNVNDRNEVIRTVSDHLNI